MSTQKNRSFDRVRKIGLALPGVVEGMAYGSPALKVGGKMFACLAAHRSAEPNTLVVLLPMDSRNEFVAEQRDIYYLKDHYVPYPCVLVRLARVGEDALRELLLMGYRFVSTAKKRKTRKPTRR